jgi:uncharacterized repeat protein (TIGR03803 family)
MRSKRRYSTARIMFALFVTLLSVSVVPAQTQATKFKVLHTFHGPNGAAPFSQLVRDSAGNLYGTTAEGGKGACGKNGCGTAFKLDTAGKQVWLHSFNGENGYSPSVGLLRGSQGVFYGTTVYGGNYKCFSIGCGTAFELDPNGHEKMLYKFTGNVDGIFPGGPLVKDASGKVYGTTSGGAYNLGNVFKLNKTGKETALYSFTGGSDGCFPDPGPILDAAGNLYGVTSEGGVGFCNSGYGVVYKLDSSGDLAVLHTFDAADGANPDSVLLLDSQGNLYGTTENGGSGSGCGDTGCGTVFKVSPKGNGSWSEAVLYNFCSLKECADGQEPHGAGLLRDSSGNLYGTTYFGGAYQCGVVFKLDSSGAETVLHSFSCGSDGAFPSAGLVMDSSGNLYGTTELGGDRNCAVENGNGCGVVFKLTP